MRLYVIFCAFFGLLFASSPLFGATWEILVEENKALNTRHYLLTDGDCKILWRLQFFQNGKGFGIREEVHCELPLQEQIPMRQALLQKVASETNQMQGVRNFVWGTIPNKNIFMPRLAAALAASGNWDANTGRLRGKAAQNRHFLSDLINQQNLFSEVLESFAKEGWLLQVVDLEKLQTGSITTIGKFPTDCAIVFSLTMQK